MYMHVYEIIINQILEKLEKGVIPWQKPWIGGEQPQNLITKIPYKGINTFMLLCSDFSSPYWASYKQITKFGGQVIKGEKGWPVVFWKWIENEVEDDAGNTFTKKVPFMRYYKVFNIEQTTGIPEDKIPKLKINLDKNSRLNNCEKIIKNMPKKPKIVFKQQRAFYSSTGDYVNMPKLETFKIVEGYYSTFFHELIHSTGHKKRLNRKTVTDATFFGMESYSKEELIAEMGATFLCGHTGIENKTINNSASYINSWLGKLKNDKQLVIQAAGAAQKATDYILKRNKKKEKNNGNKKSNKIY